MNTENLYFGEIKRVEQLTIPPKTSHVDYLILKKTKDDTYRDIFSLFKKKYPTTYQQEGDIFLDQNSDTFLFINEAIPKEQAKNNKKKKELKKALEQLIKEMQIDTSKVFIGYIAQVTKVDYCKGTGDTILKRFLTGTNKFQFQYLKRTILLKENNDKYIDLITGITYGTNPLSQGDIFIPTKEENILIPFNNYLTEEERYTNLSKRKILRRFEQIKGSEE